MIFYSVSYMFSAQNTGVSAVCARCSLRLSFLKNGRQTLSVRMFLLPERHKHCSKIDMSSL